MWRHPQVKKEWTDSNEKIGQVRFARDAELRPYLTTTEVKVCGCVQVGHVIIYCCPVDLFRVECIAMDLVVKL